LKWYTFDEKQNDAKKRNEKIKKETNEGRKNIG